MGLKIAHAEALYRLARLLRSRSGRYHYIANWFGRRSGSAQTRYVCHICDCIIDTESSRYPMTKHAATAIEQHGEFHLENSPLVPFM